MDSGVTSWQEVAANDEDAEAFEKAELEKLGGEANGRRQGGAEGKCEGK